MAQDQNNEITIENNTATWPIKIIGDVNGLYVGTFKFKCYLTPLEQIAANKEYRQLLGEHASLASEHESSLAYALTQLKYRVVSAPPFWSSGDAFNGNLPDDNVILAVLNAAIESEIMYKKSLKKSTVETLTKAKAIAERIADNADIDDEVEADDAKNTSQK